MHQASPVIHCPNLKCRATNPEGERVCQNCGVSVPQRYLWVTGAESLATVGSSLMERYLFRGPQVVLDMQPGLPLASTFDITDALLPYLKLFPLRLHLPQVYSLVSLETAAVTIVLLEGVPLVPGDFSEPELPLGNGLSHVAVAEVFTEAWRSAPILRQVDWLWQMVQLWEPFQREGVAHSLINPQLLRVEGPLLRLRELAFDPQTAPSLADLGQFWAKWSLPYVDRWRSKFTELCDRLIDGHITTPEPLVAELEAWLAAVRTASRVRIAMATRTDPGPTREHNEDACYPHDGTVLQNAQEGLTIVCDGVGGHAGGEVASAIAITVLTEHLQQVDVSTLTTADLMAELEVAVGSANDLIVQQNDQENRHDRDRMGTTVVMALAQGHDLYLTNLGDSRAYLITAQGCYQVTTDDDIGTREVRLGYLPYREAIRQPGSGSLIQALGMVPSSMLRPAVQRFVLDSDCLFLLCSDGLSDFERVESVWEDELLPLLFGKIDLAEAAKRLIVIANRLNGHDNVTVGLLHCRMAEAAQNREGATPDEPSTWQSPLPVAQPPSARPKHLVREPSKLVPLLLLLGFFALLGGGAAIGMLFFWRPSTPSKYFFPSLPAKSSAPIYSPTKAGLASYWQVTAQRPNDSSPPLSLPPLELKASALETASSLGALTPNMVLKVITDQKNFDQIRWLQVQVCQVPEAVANPTPPNPTSSVAPPPSQENPSLKLKDIGYIKATSFEASVVPVSATKLSTLNLEGCAADTVSKPSP